MAVLVIAEHAHGALSDATHKVVTAASKFGGDVDVLAGNGPLTIDIMRGNFSGIGVTGRIQQTASGPFVGTLNGIGSGFDGTIALSEQGKFQRAVIDALEDVKAQDIKVFNTTHLTSLFDRVVMATATSNRQTRALAASVADCGRALKLTGITIEGEDTGEWVVVDLGDIVIHIMQPAIRQYYNLEEIWGDKPVRVKLLPESTARSAMFSSGDEPA